MKFRVLVEKIEEVSPKHPSGCGTCTGGIVGKFARIGT